jgi:FkbM family methyltransferase
MRRNRELVCEIDAARAELAACLNAPPGPAAYAVHFAHIWEQINAQLGWDRFDPDGRSMLRLLPLAKIAMALVRREFVPIQRTAIPLFDWIDARWLSRILPPRIRPIPHVGRSPVLYQQDGRLRLSPSPEHVRIETLFGFSLYVSGWDDHRYLGYGTNASEAANTALIDRLLPHAGYFVDVGANVGFYSLLVGTSWPDRHVIACEPNLVNVRALRAGVAANALQSTVDVIDKAISDRIGTVQLRESRLGSGGHSIVSSEAMSDETTEVGSTTLDELARSHDLGQRGIGLIKIDVENAEAAVLRGAASLLGGANPPIILYEATGDAKRVDEVARMLQQNGYSIHNIVEARPRTPILSAYRRGSTAQQANYLALPGHAQDLVDELAAAVDLRPFTPIAWLIKVRDFLLDSLSSWDPTRAGRPTTP